MRPCKEAGNETSGNVEQIDLQYAALCDEYADVFTEPGEPVSRLLDHAVELVDEAAPPPRQWQFRLS